MLTGSELTTAITAVLVGAVCLGFLLHWLWASWVGARRSHGVRIGEMAERLHEADLAREDSELARRLVTTSPDVTVSTNLGGWVNRRDAADHNEMAAID